MGEVFGIKIIDSKILDELTASAKASPRLRMNLNFHQSLDEKSHQFLNAHEPRIVEPVPRSPTMDEVFVKHVQDGHKWLRVNDSWLVIN